MNHRCQQRTFIFKSVWSLTCSEFFRWFLIGSKEQRGTAGYPACFVAEFKSDFYLITHYSFKSVLNLLREVFILILDLHFTL